MHNEVVKSDIHSTDAFGFSELVFAVSHLLGFSYAPRFKNLPRQVRELILSDQGIAVAEVCTAGGDVPMGTARWQKEAAEKTEQERILAEAEHKRREVTLARAELGARIEALEQELKEKEAEAERLTSADARHKLDLARPRLRPARCRG